MILNSLYAGLMYILSAAVVVVGMFLWKKGVIQGDWIVIAGFITLISARAYYASSMREYEST